MLSPELIKQAEINVKNYIEEGMLKKVSPKKEIIQVLVQKSDESLLETQRVKAPLWKIVISYYSMFYIANAVLLDQGKKVGEKIPHKVTSDALIVFVRRKLKKELIKDYERIKDYAFEETKTDVLLQNYENERNKRSQFQYNISEKAKESKANTSKRRAEEFVFSMKKILFDK